MAAAWSDVVARGEAARRRGGAACGVMRHSAAWRGGARFDSARHGLAWRAVPCRGVAWRAVAWRGVVRQAHRSTHEGKRGTEVVGNHPAARVIASLRRSAAIVLVSFPNPSHHLTLPPSCLTANTRCVLSRSLVTFSTRLSLPPASTVLCRSAIFALSFSDLMLA